MLKFLKKDFFKVNEERKKYLNLFILKLLKNNFLKQNLKIYKNNFTYKYIRTYIYRN